MQYHFRSIDTWLDGVLRSHCDEHLWQSDALCYVDATGKRSIFCDAEEEDEQAQGQTQHAQGQTQAQGLQQEEDCAGGDDEPELDFVACNVVSHELDSSNDDLRLGYLLTDPDDIACLHVIVLI